MRPTKWLPSLLAVLILSAGTAYAAFTGVFDSDPTHSENLAGVHVGKASTDTFSVGMSWDVDGVAKWNAGLDSTMDYSYPGITPTPPDLVLAYRTGFHTDNFRMRWDDARTELGQVVGHPVMPFQFSVTAGNSDVPLGGVAIGAYDYQYHLYLYNRRATTRRTQLNFYNCFSFLTDLNQNGTKDFQLYNISTATPSYTVSPTNDFCLKTPKAGFFSATPVTKPVVTGSWTAGTAQKSVLAALVQLGFATDNTTP
jgi:hypothetical protein